MSEFHKNDVINAHKASSNHRHILRDSKLCGCFYCLDIFDYKNIQDWCDDDNTALCPSCGIDSVIGSASGYLVSKEFLAKMHEYWF